MAPALHPGASLRAEERPAPAEESGAPPRGQRLQAIVARALEDSIVTWKHLMAAQAGEIETINLRFVSRLGPANCYGLYAGEGPAYCSGNQTVFVGTREADRLMATFGPQGEAGITFLIGHEMGHHIQNIQGRFYLLSHIIARAPASRLDLMRRFELEADCYAGVWIKASPAWASSARFRADLRKVLARIGDDTILGHEPNKRVAALAVHGSSEQRTRWFMRGAQSGDWHACDVLSAATP
jgi:predicted metalloprotease